MPSLVLLCFLAIPLIEVVLFVTVGDWVGLWLTLALIVMTALIGVALLRYQGVGLLLSAQQRLERGEAPVNEIFNGILLALAGAFLLTPGFFTDTLGFALLVPAVRRALIGWIGISLATRMRATAAARDPESRHSTTTIIDGDFVHMTSQAGNGQTPDHQDSDQDLEKRGTASRKTGDTAKAALPDLDKPDFDFDIGG